MKRNGIEMEAKEEGSIGQREEDRKGDKNGKGGKRKYEGREWKTEEDGRGREK